MHQCRPAGRRLVSLSPSQSRAAGSRRVTQTGEFVLVRRLSVCTAFVFENKVCGCVCLCVYAVVRVALRYDASCNSSLCLASVRLAVVVVVDVVSYSASPKMVE